MSSQTLSRTLGPSKLQVNTHGDRCCLSCSAPSETCQTKHNLSPYVCALSSGGKGAQEIVHGPTEAKQKCACARCRELKLCLFAIPTCTSAAHCRTTSETIHRSTGRRKLRLRSQRLVLKARLFIRHCRNTSPKSKSF
jgi:hypothetical protein